MPSANCSLLSFDQEDIICRSILELKNDSSVILFYEI